MTPNVAVIFRRVSCLNVQSINLAKYKFYSQNLRNISQFFRCEQNEITKISFLEQMTALI